MSLLHSNIKWRTVYIPCNSNSYLCGVCGGWRGTGTGPSITAP